MNSEQSFVRDENEDLEADPEFSTATSRKKRGPTTLAKVLKSNSGVKKVVEWNELGQPIGPASKQLFSYMGVLARNMVPIIHEKWNSVSKTLKEKIWSCLKGKFVLHSETKRKLMKGVGEKWRSFKSRLTRKYIMPFKDQEHLLIHPPSMYKFIEQHHWEAFVKSRMTKDFQVVRKIQSDKRKKNIHPHRLSRKGYAGLVEELKKSGQIQFDDLDRSFLWKRARQDKKGVFVNDATKEKAMEIDDLIKQVEEGSLVTDGSDDVLTLALGNPEHSGQVRAVGQFVTRSSYFHIPRPKLSEEREARMKAEEELRETKDRLSCVEEQLAQLIRTQDGTPTQTSVETCSHVEKDRLSRLEEQVAMLLQAQQSTPSFDSEKTYSYANKPSASDGCQPIMRKDDKKTMLDEMLQMDSKLGKGKPCKLALGLKSNIVASGLVFASSKTDLIHNVAIAKDKVRVAIENAVVPKAPLPVPLESEEVFLVEEAIGYHVAWPKDLVIITSQSNSIKQNKRGSNNKKRNL